ncbi:MAG TPA: Ig-like domain repeat protein [Isosphaeraceae bacterium]
MRFHDIRRGRRDEARPDRRAKRARARRAVGAPALETLEGRVVLAVSTWTGATSTLWSVATNWNNPPISGNDLSFPSTGLRTTNVNDLAADTPFGSVSFNSAGYSITGDEVILTGSITASQGSGVDAFDLPIKLNNALTVAVANAQATVHLGGVISEGGTAEGLSKSGPGVAVLSGANTYTGPTTVSAGTLQVDSLTSASAITVNAGGTLDGVGTVPSITSTGGTVSPGDAGGPGILTVSGGFSLDSQSKFAVAINGTNAGSGYGQVAAGGAIALGGTLSVTLGTTPTGNQQFTLIHNTSGSAATGTFTGLPEGSEVVFGNQSFRITYNTGASHDVVLTHLLGSSTTVGASPSSTTFGTPVTLTASVIGVGGGGTPTGTVEFLDGSTVLGSNSVNASGVATFPTSSLPVGTDQITAIYKGDTTFATSTSPAATVTIAKAPTTTTLVVQPTSTVFGQPVTLTATVASTTSGLGTPTGFVEFLNGTTEIQTVQVNPSGVATLTTSSLPVGSDSITAVYQSDNTFATSTSTPPIIATVGTVPTTATLVVSPTNPGLGQTVTLIAAVTPNSPSTGIPTGTVTFLDGTTTLGSAPLNSSGIAVFTTTGLTGGSNVLEASYASDGTFSAATSPTVTVTIPQSASTTVLTASPNPSILGQSTTLMATVLGVNSGSVIPTGTVQFFNGTTSLGTASVNGGVATLTTSALPLGTASVTAAYSGDVSFTASTSPALSVQVTQAGTRVTLTPTIANPGPTQTEVFNVSVASGASGVTPTGTVEVFSSGVLLGSATLSSGAGTITVKNLPIGNQIIAAVYTGDATNAPSASAAQTLPVGTQVEQYLNAIYIDALGRQIDTGTIIKINNGGLAAWLTKYVTNHAIRGPVVKGIVNSRETRQFAIHSTYLNVAGKQSTLPQQQNAFLGTNGTSLKLNSRVFGGPAYFAKVGASIEAYLTALGNDILGGPLPASLDARFTAELEHGTPRSTVVFQLLQSPEGKLAQVNGLYQRILGRPVDPAGLKESVGLLNQGKSNARILINLFSSPEFFNQFSQTK